MQKFLQILENAKNGVLLVSWGGNFNSSSIPEHIHHEMLKGFTRLPLEVIWKWENVSIQQIAPKNVHVTTWLPQQDLLCEFLCSYISNLINITRRICLGHPNVKAFWTHGGNLGAIESVHCGKPLIVTPFNGDQFMNAAALGQRGIGFKREVLQISADRISDDVERALDPRSVKIFFS